jgi:hypothetical protein
MIIEATRYHRPHGQQEPVTTEVSDDLREKWQQIQDRGCIMTVEMLGFAGQISVCIDDQTVEDDYLIRTIKNDPNHPEKMTALLEEMIGSFDPAEHERWRTLVRGEQELPQDAADLAGPDD